MDKGRKPHTRLRRSCLPSPHVYRGVQLLAFRSFYMISMFSWIQGSCYYVRPDHAIRLTNTAKLPVVLCTGVYSFYAYTSKCRAHALKSSRPLGTTVSFEGATVFTSVSITNFSCGVNFATDLSSGFCCCCLCVLACVRACVRACVCVCVCVCVWRRVRYMYL